MPDLPDIVDLFSGPRGWSEGLKMLGLRDIGLDINREACLTSAAAGHLTIQTDVTQYPTHPFARPGIRIIGSPVCTPYSRAGKGLGLQDQPIVAEAVHDLAHGRDTRTQLGTTCADPLSILAAEPMRWLHDLRPKWAVLEQVPDVLPLWQQYATHLRAWGYSVWTGILNAADYGVPQTRRRAILIASQVRDVNQPETTHYDPRQGLRFWGTPWVSMADALDLPPGVVVNTRGERPKDERGRAAGGNEFPADGPSQALTGRARSWKLRSGQGWKLKSGQSVNGHGRYERDADEPAFTITGTANRCKWVMDGAEERNLSLEEAATLQTFPAGHPWHGSRTAQFQQIGNAVPPLLAAHIVAAAEGIPMPHTATSLAA